MIRDDLVEQSKKLLEKLSTVEAGTKEYHDLLSDIKNLNADIREFDRQEAELGWSDQLNEAKLAELNKPFYRRDGFLQAVIGAGCTFGTTALMLNYEKLNNITSKALSVIPKPKFRS